MITVSVIIPTYNRADVIEKAIGSVLNQSYRDFEVLVIDDGSTDNTTKVVEKLPVKYIWQRHHGAPSARNRGIAQARGKYIAFLDSDDWWLPGKLEKQVAVMESNTDVVLSHTSYQRNEATVNTSRFSGNVYPKLYYNCPIATPTVMVRRSALKGHRFLENLNNNDEVIMWAEIVRGTKIIGISEPLCGVKVGANTNAFNRERQLSACDNIIRYGIKRDVHLSPLIKDGLIAYWNVIKLRLKYAKS
jgi:glycosyltransferase involved in cell wall biosynthesis